MADFSLAQIGETSGGASPQPAVERPNPITAAVSFASGVGESIFGAMADTQEKEQQEMANKAVTRFSEQQMLIAELVDQGKMSSQEGRMRMRRNLIKAGGDNPNLSGAFTDAHKAVIGTAGMGKVAAEGTEEEQQFFKIMAEARENGFIGANASQEQATERTYDWIELNNARLQRTLAMEELAQKQAQLTFRRGQIGAETDMLNLQTARQEKKVRDATMNGARAFLPKFSENVQEIVDLTRIPKEEGGIDAVEADLRMRVMLDQVEGEVGQGGASVPASMRDGLLTPYRRMIDTASGVISGKFANEVMESQRTNIIKQQELLQLANPGIVEFIATSNNLGQNGGVVLQEYGTTAAADMLTIYAGNNQEEGTRPNIFSNPLESVEAYGLTLKNGLRQVNGNEGSPTAQEETSELGRQINSTFAAVGKYAEGEQFEKVKPILQQVASDEYGTFITSKGKGVVRKEHQAEFGRYIETLFEDDIAPLISEEWRNATTQLSGERMGPGPEGQTEESPTSTLIRPMFVGDSIEFVKTNRAGENPRIDREIRRLNQEVKPAVDFFIRLQAHGEEHTDYKRIYEQNFARMFGDPGTGSAAEE